MPDDVEETQNPVVESTVTEDIAEEVPEVKASSSSELKDLLTKVRQEEKQKVYNRIENLETQAKIKDGKIQDLEKTIVDLQSKLTGKDEEKKTELQILTETVSVLQERLDKVLTSQESERSEFQKKQKELELDKYREKKIAMAKGKIIPEMVKGMSEAEIDTSYVLAKQRYQEIISSAVNGRDEEIERTPTPPAVTPTRNENSGQFTVDDIQRMSPAEYAAHRRDLLKQAAPR